MIFRAAPGDATTALRCLSCTDEVRLQVRQELGLDKSKFQQYVIYLKDLAHGDFGRSFQNRQPVLPQLWQPLKNTLPMLLLGTLFSIVLRPDHGGGRRLATRHAGRRSSSVWIGLAFFSLPTQWLAIMLILYAAGPLGLPTNGISDPYLSFTNPGLWAEFTDRLSHMVLPSLTLGLVLYGEYTLITRSALLETFGEDYVLTARAKGLTRLAGRAPARPAQLAAADHDADLPLARLHHGRLDPDRGRLQLPGHRPARLPERLPEGLPDAAGRVPRSSRSSVVLANLIADLLYVRLDPRIVE